MGSSRRSGSKNPTMSPRKLSPSRRHRLDCPGSAAVGTAAGLVSGERRRARARLVTVVIAIAAMPTSAAVV
jgi:hypothetical protein